MEARFSQEFCERHRLFPPLDPGSTEVVISEVSDLSVLDFVRFRTRAPISVRHDAPQEVARLIATHFGVHMTTRTGAGEQPAKTADSGTPGRVIQMVNKLIADAIGEGASDVHFEPSPTGIQCRVRIDGRLQSRIAISAADAPEVISRIKIMAGMDIAERRRPQDGRIRFGAKGRDVDIRVSIIPCKSGEKVVLRLLDSERLKLDLKTIGLESDQLQIFTERVSQPNGIVLVTGPTGSGKTTTLYAALSYLKSPELNISTVEDPIEYDIAGINQTQIRPEIGLTFSAMLRAMLRQDPNVIMVGEIRDQETLEIAIRASLTGHMVLSTLHTNGAMATLSRLVDMGAEPLLLATSVRLIAAQRLVRRICLHCAVEGWSDSDRIAAAKLGVGSSVPGRHGVGCERCRGTGFAGRSAIFELLAVTPTIQQQLTSGGTEQDLAAVAPAEGFRPMTDAARRLVEAGITTPLEVMRELAV